MIGIEEKITDPEETTLPVGIIHLERSKEEETSSLSTP